MITLCVPTFNRPAFIERLLRYYAATDSRHWIFIGDSSHAEAAARTRQAVESRKGQLQVRYEACPGLSSCAALEHLSRLITTPYCAFLGDDDFLCPATLDRCAEFLDANPDYGAAHGRGMLFQLEIAGPYGALGTIGAYPLATLQADTGAGRLVEFFTESLYVVLNSVHRVETWRAMFRSLTDMQGVKNQNIFKDELIATCVSVIRGKVKALDGLYLMRQAHDTYHWPHVYDWLTDPGWSPSYQTFHDRLLDELLRQDGLSEEQADATIRRVFWPYLAQVVTRTWRSEQAAGARQGPSRLRAAAKRIPGLRRGWRSIRSLIQRARDPFSRAALAHPSSPYHADFMPFYLAVTNPPPRMVDEGQLPQDALAGVGASMERLGNEDGRSRSGAG